MATCSFTEPAVVGKQACSVVQSRPVPKRFFYFYFRLGGGGVGRKKEPSLF